MIRRGMLTAFQARALLDGKTRGLALGSYVVLDRLGKGGMGRLFRCMHRQMKRIVALKVLPPTLMKSQESVERFQREVEAMARLSHLNIVTAFDAGEDKGVRFLAMEYVEGSNLTSLITDRGTLPVATVVDYTLQAARGLEYAHWHGMIHRDVKPENLILDWRGTVKVLDLGIVGLVAGLTEPRADDEPPEPHSQPVAYGTPDYMAPEQSFDTAPLGPACDIYSLGCTLYFLLTGKPVFEGETAEAKVHAHRQHAPPSLRASRPDIPVPLDRLFQRMLAKRPEDRPATMGEVIAELERCLTLVPRAEPTLDGPGSVLEDDGENDLHDAATLPLPFPNQGTAVVTGSPRKPTVARRPGLGWILAGLAGLGLLAVGMTLGLRRQESGLGSLVIDMRVSHASVQIVDAAGETVIECPAAKGQSKFALPAGLYRLIVRDGDSERLNQEIKITARQNKVVEVTNPGGTE
jgi:serine/threonine protein kinase